MINVSYIVVINNLVYVVLVSSSVFSNWINCVNSNIYCMISSVISFWGWKFNWSSSNISNSSSINGISNMCLFKIFFIVLGNISSVITFGNLIEFVEYVVIGGFNSKYLVIMLVVVSGGVILFGVYYLGIMDSMIFFIILVVFILVMMNYISSSEYSSVWIYMWWEYLGMCSYFLINYWCSSINCGINALFFNKFGDLSFLNLIGYFFGVFYCYDFLYMVNCISFSSDI